MSEARCCHTSGGSGTDTANCHRCHAEVYNCDRGGLMSHRHPKWQRVEPGTVIPAGQPYRKENPGALVFRAVESVTPRRAVTVDPSSEWFVDSSWKPPLVLPTEPTWGIAVYDNLMGVAQWSVDGDLFRGKDYGHWRVENVEMFIPLTDEQVARIGAER